MLRKILAALTALFLCGTTAAQATIVGPLPYTLANGSTADAAQVMANFNKIVNDVNNNVIFPSFTQQNYYAADTGAANAMVVSLSPTPALYVAGMVVNVKVAASNTGATTINANGLGLQNVVNLDGSTLKAQQLLTGMTAQLVYDGSRFQLNSVTPQAQRQNTVGRTTSTFNTAGPWTFTVPASVYHIRIEAWGGGGGGGGSNNATGAAGGGGGGAYGLLYLDVVPGDVLSGQIDGPGTGGTGSGNGTVGGSTTVRLNGVLQGTVNGGGGGVGSTGAITGAGVGGSATGSWNVALTGGVGPLGVANGAGNIASGGGGPAPRGGVGGQYSGGNGGNPGGGGGGAFGVASGANGGAGWVYLEY